MESWEKSAIWKVICHVQNNNIQEAIPLCTAAISEFEEINKRINIGRRNKIDIIKIFINNVSRQQYNSAQQQTEEAAGLFEIHIKPFLEEEERKLNKEKDINKSESKAGLQRDKLNEGVSNEHVKRSIKRGTDGLVVEFKDLYINGSWRAAFNELNAVRQSDVLSIECLLVIVREAFAYCQSEASAQLKLAAEYAHQIVRDGNLPHEKPKTIKEKPANDLLHRYRYIHAKLATERLQKDFLKIARQHLEETYNIRINKGSGMECFVNDCTELTWLMCVEDPPISVHQQVSGTIDPALYELKKSALTCIVWPALQLGLNGQILAKGVAFQK